MNLPVGGTGHLSRNASHTVPFVIAARKPNRPLPAISLRVPVTPANRNYLRKLRNDEMRAWQESRAGHKLDTIPENTNNAPGKRRDLYVFGLVVTLTTLLAGVILGHSSGVTQQCAHLVSYVRHLLG